MSFWTRWNSISPPVSLARVRGPAFTVGLQLAPSALSPALSSDTLVLALSAFMGSPAVPASHVLVTWAL